MHIMPVGLGYEGAESLLGSGLTGSEGRWRLRHTWEITREGVRVRVCVRDASELPMRTLVRLQGRGFVLVLSAVLCRVGDASTHQLFGLWISELLSCCSAPPLLLSSKRWRCV